MSRLTIAVALLLMNAAVLPAGEFHVSPNGNDSNPGTAEKPFRTIEFARDAARGSKGSTIILANGRYYLDHTLVLDARDSGTHYTTSGGADLGGRRIPNSTVKPVTDAAVLNRLLPEVRGKVLEIDLKSLGVTDFGTIGPRGFGRPYVTAPIELIIDDQPLSLSQWPKPGNPGEPMGKIIDSTIPAPGTRAPAHGGTFEFSTDRPKRWTSAADAWITGFFNNGYADDTLQIKSIDLKQKSLTTVQRHGYGFASGQAWNRWTALNLLEEIELPGEFMADKSSGKLYFLPPKDKAISQCLIEVTMMSTPLVAIEGASGVVFDGITFECTRGMGVYIERGENNRIQNATLRNIGIIAVCIGQGEPPTARKDANPSDPSDHWRLGSPHNRLYGNPTWNRQAGTGQGIVNCQIYNIGSGAISLSGGDRLSLDPGRNFVENCDIHHFNRWDRTYRGAVNIDGVGNVIRHCLIHDCPGCAILLHGNDHIIEYNEIHHAMMEGDDNAAFYMGRDPTERGNVLRYNYFHDVATTHRNFALYFDDGGGDGTLIQGNIFRKAGNARSININGGSDIRIINNIFIDRPPIGAKPKGQRHIDERLCESRLKAVKFDQSPWREKYPEMLRYLNERDQMPRNILFSKNLVVHAKIYESDSIKFDNNRSVSKEPDLKDVGISGFENIPLESIGLIKHDKR